MIWLRHFGCLTFWPGTNTNAEKYFKLFYWIPHIASGLLSSWSQHYYDQCENVADAQLENGMTLLVSPEGDSYCCRVASQIWKIFRFLEICVNCVLLATLSCQTRRIQKFVRQIWSYNWRLYSCGLLHQENSRFCLHTISFPVQVMYLGEQMFSRHLSCLCFAALCEFAVNACIYFFSISVCQRQVTFLKLLTSAQG